MKATDAIDNSREVIDSRDVIERIDYLAYMDDEPEADRDADEWKELTTLRALMEEAEGYSPDWKYGATLVSDSYFTEYAEEMLKDCGTIPKDLPWYVEIDWEKTASHIQQNYTSVEFDGATYWVR